MRHDVSNYLKRGGYAPPLKKKKEEEREYRGFINIYSSIHI